MSAALLAITARLRDTVDALSFGPPTHTVYNPLRYAWASHAAYIERFGAGPKEAVFLGMNPGPWGMAQTGVPFGEIAHVRDWMGIEAPVQRPDNEHPKRPIQGFDCTRSEVSGRRLWGWAAERFGTADAFFDRFFVWNWCPLAFLEESGRNRTPDKLPVAERDALTEACDAALAEAVRALCVRAGLCADAADVELEHAEGGIGADLVRITGAGLRESHVHDVQITRESPNYRIG